MRALCDRVLGTDERTRENRFGDNECEAPGERTQYHRYLIGVDEQRGIAKFSHKSGSTSKNSYRQGVRPA